MSLLHPAPAGTDSAKLGFVANWATGLQRDAAFFRRLAVAALLGQVAFLCAAIASRLMLFGDGAFFVYALATGHAWELKWQFLTTRLSAYVFTVLPAEGICQALSCDGVAFAAVNSATFYALPVLQFACLIAMAWRRFPALLVFPIAQYAFALGLGYGFPSEILLAPGFFWMALFSLLLRPWPIVLFIVSFAGLVFSHELALAAALVVVCFFAMQWRTQRAGNARALFLLFAMFIILSADLYLIVQGGGEGGNSNAVHVFELKRVLKNPTLWLVCSCLGVSAGIALFAARFPPLWAVGLVWGLAVAVAGEAVNFAQGRYDSARTVIGVAMLLLGVLLLLLRRRSAAMAIEAPKFGAFLRLSLVGGLVVTFTANALFLIEWNKGLAAFDAAVNARYPKPGIVYLTPHKADLGWKEAEAIERAGFSWTWPYRSIVLAQNYRPQAVFYLPDSIGRSCGSPRLASFTDSPVPAAVSQDISRFACRMTRGGI